jgi:predicted permease
MSLRRYFQRAKWHRERAAEIDEYLQFETDDNIARGMSHAEARAAAQRKLGNTALIREEIYRMNTIAFLDTLQRDLRYAFRGLRRNPVFTATALLTLAIGIGANTAVFSVLNSVLLKPLAYPHPDELVAVWQSAPGAPGLASVSGDLRLSPSMFFTYAGENHSFQSMGLWFAQSVTVTGFAEPEEVRAVVVTAGVLETLAVPPAVGRWLNQADQQPGGPDSIMLGHGYWLRRFGGDRSAIGRRIIVDGRSREIVGVMPRSFRVLDNDPEVIGPVRFDKSKLTLPGFGFQGVARLKPGVTIQQADADISRLVPVWMNSWPAYTGGNPRIYETWRIAGALRPLKSDVVGSAGNVLWVLMGTIGIVMLIVCANVGNLLLVRAETRHQALAVRAALGAGRGRIVREMLTESALLGLMGGVLGLGLAWAGLRLLVAIGPATLPRLNEIALDPWVLAFTFAVSLFCGLLFGLIPALKFAGQRNAPALNAGGRTSSATRERHRAQSLLVVCQVAMATVLLVASGLMIRTFEELRKVQPGFSHNEPMQLFRTAFTSSSMPDQQLVARQQNDLVNRLAAIPGVSAVSFADATPLQGLPPDWDAIRPEGRAYDGIPPLRRFKYVAPGYFQTIGTRLLAGREYNWTDLAPRRRVVIVSENLARELWQTPAAAIGKRIQTIEVAPWQEVIGVVEDVRDNGIQEPPPAAVYWPSMGESKYGGGLTVVRSVTFAIRSPRAGSDDLLRQVKQAVWGLNPNLPMSSVETMAEVYDKSLARPSFALVMIAIAGSMALLLGIVGIYGVLSYAVTQRRREIGIRLALGAQQGALRSMFVRHGLALTGIGLSFGLAASLGLTRLMSSLLFGIGFLDPVTYAGALLLLALAAALASFLPAWQASSVDPAGVLKAE